MHEVYRSRSIAMTALLLVKLILLLILPLGYAANFLGPGQGSCEVPSFNTTPPHSDQLGTSTLYVYSHMNVSSPCSGNVNSLKLCYEMTAPPTSTDVESREIATVLILDRIDLSLRVREVIPIRVNTTPIQCETREIQQPGCCVTRPINSTFHLQIGEQPDFLFAVSTPTSYESLGLRLGGYTDSRVKGFTVRAQPEYSVGESLMQHPQIDIVIGLISFSATVSAPGTVLNPPPRLTPTTDATVAEEPTATVHSTPGNPITAASRPSVSSGPLTSELSTRATSGPSSKPIPSGSSTGAKSSTAVTRRPPTSEPSTTTGPSGSSTTAPFRESPAASTLVSVATAGGEGEPLVDVSKYTDGLIGLGVISLLLLVVSVVLATLTAVLCTERCRSRDRKYTSEWEMSVLRRPAKTPPDLFLPDQYENLAPAQRESSYENLTHTKPESSYAPPKQEQNCLQDSSRYEMANTVTLN